MKSVCLAILNYNGVHHLEHLLPSAIEAVADFGQPCPIVVLDNQSTQNDQQWVQKHFPGVNFIRAPRNEFMFSYNWLAEQRREEVMVLLNNDVRLTKGFLQPLLQHLDAPDVFSVCAKSLSWDGAAATCGPAKLLQVHGFYRWHYETERQEFAHTLFSSSGFMAVDREKFLQLGGFCRLFYPMYCDDLDLGFRAWRRGWRSIYEPRSVLYHRDSGSSASKWVQENHLKNSLLFEWANLPLEGHRLERLARTVNIMRHHLMHGKIEWPRIWFKTWWSWVQVRKKYRHFKINKVELRRIQAQIASPVRSPDEQAPRNNPGD